MKDSLAKAPEELFAGHWGRRGVPPGSEPVIPFLDHLNPAEWNALVGQVELAAGTLDADMAAGTRPALVWPFDSLNSAQKQCIREFMSRADQQGLADAAVTLSNPAGGRLILTVIADEWYEAPLVISVQGPLLRSLRRSDEEPLFIEGGPRFSAALPAGMSGSANKTVRSPLAELDYAEACAALAPALDTPVIADYYTLDGRIRLRREGMSAEDFVREMHRTFQCWFAQSQSGALLIRKQSWPQADQCEIPEEVLEQCLALKERGKGWTTLDLDALSWLAQRVSPVQLKTLGKCSLRQDRRIQLALETEILKREFALLKVVGALGPAYRAKLGGSGIPLRTVAQVTGQACQEFVRQRAPWLLTSKGTTDGWIRLAPAPVGTVLVGTPEGARPVRVELAYYSGGSLRHRSFDTRIPAPR